MITAPTCDHINFHRSMLARLTAKSADSYTWAMCRQTVTCSRDGTAVFWQGCEQFHKLRLENPTEVLCKGRNRSRIDCALASGDSILFGVASGIFSCSTPSPDLQHQLGHPIFSNLGTNDWVYSMLWPSRNATSAARLLAVIGSELHVLKQLKSGTWRRDSTLIKEHRSAGRQKSGEI